MDETSFNFVVLTVWELPLIFVGSDVFFPLHFLLLLYFRSVYIANNTAISQVWFHKLCGAPFVTCYLLAKRA